MSLGWINLSTRWSMSSVQAALNVFISVLGTVGVWSFSRYWWQRGCNKILRSKSSIPLPALCTIASPGDGWDVAVLLHRRLLSKDHWRLLVQIFVIVTATVACMLAGPIAKLSLRSTVTLQTDNLEVLQTTKGEGFTNNVLDHEVLWNETIHSLDRAGFPEDQLLDYIILEDVPWTYVASEWDPTWSMKCDKFPETVLHNVTGAGNYSFYDPLHAFPAFRDTYDDFWLNETEFRVQGDFISWIIQDGTDDPPFTDVLMFVLIISNPELDDRMYTNNETLQLSLSIYHLQHFRISDYADFTEGAATKWAPVGPVSNASYTRIECAIQRNRQDVDPNRIPWPWTNNTYSITFAFDRYWDQVFEDSAARSLPVFLPTPDDILRFYQVYTVTANTIHSFAFNRPYSILQDTVQLSVVFLGIFSLLAALTIGQTARYFIFLRRHKSKLDKTFVPDGKLEWMLHTAKVSAETEDEATSPKTKFKDQDYFRGAVFGYHTPSDGRDVESNLEFPGLARVYTSRGSLSGNTRDGRAGRRSLKVSIPPEQLQHPPTIVVLEANEPKRHPSDHMPNCDHCKDGLGLAVTTRSVSSTSSRSGSRDQSLCPGEKRQPSPSPSHPACSCSESNRRPSSDGSVATMVGDGQMSDEITPVYKQDHSLS